MSAAIDRLQQPQPLEHLGIGLVLALNAQVVRVLLKASRRFDSHGEEAYNTECTG